MSTTHPMSDPAKSNRSLPAAVIVAGAVVVVIAVAVAAFVMFGPKPEPHPRYNTVELMQKAQKDINSLTPDERRVYNHITHADIPAPKFKGAPPVTSK